MRHPCSPSTRPSIPEGGAGGWPNVAVLVAPPGAGKTTVVPLALMDEPWVEGRRIIVLEPRRIAARAAAARMASTLGEPVGERVGFRVRMQSKVSARTRVEVVTEGVFTRMILDDPGLDGVAGVLFDEFHERSLDADLGLAFARDAQGLLRDDLRLLVMSATLDGARIAALLDDAPVIRSEGRAFSVETRHLGRDPALRLEEQAARAVRKALAEEDGGVLVFLPGQGEIRRVETILAERLPEGVIVAPLYGALDPAEQDRAIEPAPHGKRKVVLATSIAETSLTIEGVRVVVDAGFARVPRYDPSSGLTRLETVRVSQASAGPAPRPRGTDPARRLLPAVGRAGNPRPGPLRPTGRSWRPIFPASFPCPWPSGARRMRPAELPTPSLRPAACGRLHRGRGRCWNGSRRRSTRHGDLTAHGRLLSRLRQVAAAPRPHGGGGRRLTARGSARRRSPRSSPSAASAARPPTSPTGWSGSRPTAPPALVTRARWPPAGPPRPARRGAGARRPERRGPARPRLSRAGGQGARQARRIPPLGQRPRRLSSNPTMRWLASPGWRWSEASAAARRAIASCLQPHPRPRRAGSPPSPTGSRPRTSALEAGRRRGGCAPSASAAWARSRSTSGCSTGPTRRLIAAALLVAKLRREGSSSALAWGEAATAAAPANRLPESRPRAGCQWPDLSDERPDRPAWRIGSSRCSPGAIGPGRRFRPDALDGRRARPHPLGPPARASTAPAPTRFTAPTGDSFAIDYAAEGGPRVEIRVQASSTAWPSIPTIVGGRAPDPGAALARAPAGAGDQGPARVLEGIMERRARRDEGPLPAPSVWPEDPLTAAPTTRAKPRGT